MITDLGLRNQLHQLWEYVEGDSSRDAFDFDGGHLGCAFLTGSLSEIDDTYPWKESFERHIAAILHSISQIGYPHPGMLGGLAGLTFLLRCIGKSRGDYSSACAKLERRLSIHLGDQLEELKNSIGADRYTYDFALGISGLIYHFEHYPSEDPAVSAIVEHAVEFMADSCKSDGLGSFWTPPTEVPDEILESDPAASLGLLDLGMAHGVTGVLSALLAGGFDQTDPSISNILKTLTAAIDDSVTSTIPYYLCLNPSVGGNMNLARAKGGPAESQPRFQERLLGPTARNAWCYGTPMLEALQIKYGLPVSSSWMSSFLDAQSIDPILGGFDGPGLCHGVAGRIALRYMVGSSIPEGWDEMADELLKLGDNDDWGFWDQRGGLLVVEVARRKGVRLPSPFALLGIKDGD